MNLGSLVEDNFAKYGEYQATWFEGKWYTNVEVDKECNRLGNALKSLGIKKGDSVAIQMPNHPVVLWGFPAVYKLGAVVVPVNPLLRPDQAAYIYQDCGASVVITSPEYVPWIQAAQKQASVLKTIVVIEKDDMPGTIGYDKFVAGQPDSLPVVETDNDDLAALIYTAGTTGPPKGVMHTHFSLYMTAIGYGDFVQRYRCTTLKVKGSKYDVRSHRLVETEQEVMGVDRRSLGLLVLPLSHSYGIATVTMGSMAAQRGLVLRWFNPEVCLQLIQEHRVTNFSGVPAMYIMMLNHPDFDKYDLSSLQECACGAAPLPPEIGRMWEEKVGTPILEGWGMTETGATTCGTIPNRPPKYGSIGVCMVRADTVKIFDDNDKEVPVGTNGEIVVKGPTVMKGYWKKPKETAEALRNGWLHTGDIGYKDSDGYFWITDRKKDIIIRGGENVSPREVEEVILMMPQVVDAGCIGVADKTYGEEIKVCVVIKQGEKLTEEEVIAFCRERLPNFKIPKVVRFMDALPKNLLGKLLRAELRKQEKEQKS
jgi:long-chain acyl-CoA synthetase